MVEIREKLTDLPNIGAKRAEVLESNGIFGLEDVAATNPARLVEIFGGQISVEQAVQVIEQAKKNNRPVPKLKRLGARMRRNWIVLVAFAGAILIFLQLPKAYLDLKDVASNGVGIEISYATSLEESFSGDVNIRVDQNSLSVINLGFPYENFTDDTYALCGALPFLLQTRSTSIIEELTLVFEIDFPDQATFDLAETAGYGSYVSNPETACAYREKTRFQDDFGRTSLSRNFIHEDGKTRIVYQFENLLPGEPVPISVAIPLLPNTFLGFGDPLRQPFHEESGNGDFSNEALSQNEISLISDPISLTISYIVDGPRQSAGDMLFYVYPGSINADLLFSSFLIAESNGFDRRRSIRQIWSGEATRILFQHLRGYYVPENFIEDILSEPQDVAMLERQYSGQNVNFDLFPAGDRISYVSERSKILASVGSVFSSTSGPMVFDMLDFNQRRNMMRTELLLSHQFPTLFQRYLEQED